MNESDPRWQLLVRFLDGRLGPSEDTQLSDLLRSDPDARAILRELAEQGVMVAEIERVKQAQREELRSRERSPAFAGNPVTQGGISFARFSNWRFGLAAAAVIVLLAAVALLLQPQTNPGMIRVAKLTGSSQYFGSDGRVESGLKVGSFLDAGGTIETRSCDAWLELQLREGSAITVAGHSMLRIMETEEGRQRLNLLRGNLWATVAPKERDGALNIQTPTCIAEVLGTQFDIQTSSSATMLRVNEGSVRVTRVVDGSEAIVPEGHQVHVSLSRRRALSVLPQPTPVNEWACELLKVPDVKLGKWLPPGDGERARLGAEPFPFPIPDRDPLMLYAVALSVWGTTEQPVLLQSSSFLRVRGRTERAERVRFGFSTQRMQGVFAGKFEMDVEPEDLGPAGETWHVDLPLAKFRPLQRHLSPSPDGLELTDIYALTIEDDAGLEINRVELLPSAARDLESNGDAGGLR